MKYNGNVGCSLSFMGDGAVNQGSVHESMNIAALFDLPAVIIIENNGYSMGTSQKRSSAYRDCLAQRAESYDMAWDLINGEDIYELRAKLHIAMERARKESLPTVLEIQTYRWYGHSVADANAKKYRTPEEIQSYKDEHDPIALWEKRLIDEGSSQLRTRRKSAKPQWQRLRRPLSSRTNPIHRLSKTSKNMFIGKPITRPKLPKLAVTFSTTNAPRPNNPFHLN